MKLGTSTNLLYIRPDGQRTSLEETITRLAKTGFKSLDFNSYDWTLPGSPLLSDDWERWVDNVALTAEKLDVTFDQCHGYFYPFLDKTLSDSDRHYHEEIQLRSLSCIKKLGAKTCVLHPETDYSTIHIQSKSFYGNEAFFYELLDKTIDYNLRFAIENMCDYGIAPKRKYCATPEELVDFIDRFNDDKLGICWDFEHADIMEQNQESSLLLIDDKLLATHVSDTYSKTDNTLMHTLPMTGTIDWPVVMKTLRTIKYKDVFSFEVHNYINKLPDEVIDTALDLAFKIGHHLLSLGDSD